MAQHSMNDLMTSRSSKSSIVSGHDSPPATQRRGRFDAP
jgi:hypothetical protein